MDSDIVDGKIGVAHKDEKSDWGKTGVEQSVVSAQFNNRCFCV